jgi:hypothetical protein
MHRARVPGKHERVGRVARHPGMSNGALELPMHASSGPVENVALLTCVLREKESRVRRWRPHTALLPPDEAVGFRWCRPGGLRPFWDGSELHLV